MRKLSPGLALSALLAHPAISMAADAAQPAAVAAPAALATPNDIVAAAPASDWVPISPSDLVVMELAPDARHTSPGSRPRRVVIQLIPPPFSQGWVENIRTLVAARWYDGIAVVRVQDNYVVQWGDPEGEVPGKAKVLPEGLQAMGEEGYVAPFAGFGDIPIEVPVPGERRQETVPASLQPAVKVRSLDRPLPRDSYASFSGHSFSGWPVALDGRNVWPIHCYGTVGVGRGLSPDTGTGAELYAVIGQAPRQLDRNIAVVGRVIAGIENLSSLPRGTGPLGFYETAGERTQILSVRMGSEVPDLPRYEYLSTDSASFAAYADKRANRKDDFYIRPAGGVDVCNVPVPVREMPGSAETPRK